jgi:hypothetical protein
LEQFWVHSRDNSRNQTNQTLSEPFTLEGAHQELRDFIDALISDFSGSESVSSYFLQRTGREPAVRQDLLPLLVYVALSGRAYTTTIPALAAWGLCLAACHFLDDAQDHGQFQNVNDGLLALGTASVALAQLEMGEERLADILDAIGRVVALATQAQVAEYRRGPACSRTDYFRCIAGKSAAIIATGTWMGARLATDDEDLLALLKSFGLALGMAIQIRDDISDLAEDLANGVYTLSVIEALAMHEHHDYSQLKRLLNRESLLQDEISETIEILESMGAISNAKRTARAYQVQAAAVFQIIPTLEQFFGIYVTP